MQAAVVGPEDVDGMILAAGGDVVAARVPVEAVKLGLLRRLEVMDRRAGLGVVHEQAAERGGAGDPRAVGREVDGPHAPVIAVAPQRRAGDLVRVLVVPGGRVLEADHRELVDGGVVPQVLPRVEAPHGDPAELLVPGDEAVAGGRPRDREEVAGGLVEPQQVDLVLTWPWGHVPEADRAIAVGGGEEAAVGREGEARGRAVELAVFEDGALGRVELAGIAARAAAAARVPHLDGVVIAGVGEHGADVGVVLPGERDVPVVVAFEALEVGAGGDVVELGVVALAGVAVLEVAARGDDVARG